MKYIFGFLQVSIQSNGICKGKSLLHSPISNSTRHEKSKSGGKVSFSTGNKFLKTENWRVLWLRSMFRLKMTKI